MAARGRKAASPDFMNQYIAEKLRTVEAGIRAIEQKQQEEAEQEDNNVIKSPPSLFCNLTALNKLYLVEDGHWIPQHHYVYVNQPQQQESENTPGTARDGHHRQQVVRHVLKYETLHENFARFLMGQYDGLENITLAAKQAGVARAAKQQEGPSSVSVSHLSKDNVEAMNRIIYHLDFVWFGYDKMDPALVVFNHSVVDHDHSGSSNSSGSASKVA